MKQLKENQKVLLFTHTDLDGYGCRIVAEHVFKPTPGTLEVCHLENNEVDDTVLSMLNKGWLGDYDFVYMTDLNVTEQTAQEIQAALDHGRIKHFQLFDHHKHALFLNEYAWATVTVNHTENELASGTSLFYDHVQLEWEIGEDDTDHLSYLVETIRRYDTWEWFNVYKYDEPRQLNDLLSLYGKEHFVQYCLQYTWSKGSRDLIEEEAHFILALEDRRIEEYINSRKKTMKKGVFQDLEVGVVFADKYHSIMGSRLHNANTGLDAMAIIDINRKAISFRTIHDDVDLSVVAKSSGGGGHAKSAGAPLTREIMDWALGVVF